MQHYFLTSILIVATLVQPIKTVKDTEEETFRFKICEIIKNSNAPLNIVYKLNGENVQSSSNNPWALEENWNTFYACLAQIPIVLRDLQKHSQEPLRSSASTSIFFMDTLESMRQVVDFLNPQQKWKPGHCYVFIWLISDQQALHGFFEKVWQKNILNVIAAVVSTQEIYTFEPFTEQDFQVKRLYEEPYFYDKLKNFHQFELRISMFENSVRAIPLENYATNGFKRIDGQLARTWVQCLNATARYIMPRDNETYGGLTNGSFTGASKDIIEGFTHISFNYRFVLDYAKSYIEQLYPYETRFLYLVVPAAKISPLYLIFINAFTYSIWSLLLISFLFMLLIFCILQRLVERLRQEPKHKHWPELLEMLVKILLGQCIKYISHTNCLRQFLMAWIIFSYIFSNVYVAKLLGSFVQGTYEPEIDHLKDLTKLNAPIYGFDSLFNAIQVSLDPKHFELINRTGIRVSRNVKAEDYAYSLVNKSENVALIINSELAREVVAHTYNAETKRTNFHIVKEYLLSLPASYMLTQGSPFIGKFQALLSASYAHGLMLHWLDADSEQKKITSNSSRSYEQVILNLTILQGAFYLWLVGICLSLVSFAAETAFGWHKKWSWTHDRNK